MTEIDIDYQNYDEVFKDSFSSYKEKIDDFLEIKLPQVDSFLETEFSEIETTKERMDLNFRLEDGSILHLEEETDISEADLLRFLSYDLKIYNRYKSELQTIVLCVNGFDDNYARIKAGSFAYKVRIVDMSERNADLKLKEIKEKVEAGEEINELDLVFLPLMQSEKEISDLVKTTIKLEQNLNLSSYETSRLAAMTLVASDKFLTTQQTEEIWEEFKMLKVFKIAEQKGLEKGMEKGLEKGEKKGVKKEAQRLVIKLLIAKFKKVPQEYRDLIKEQDEEVLEVIAEKIIDMEDINELDEYLHQ